MHSLFKGYLFNFNIDILSDLVVILTNVVLVDELKLLDEVSWARKILNMFLLFEFAHKLVVGEGHFHDNKYWKTRVGYEIAIFEQKDLQQLFMLLGVRKSSFLTLEFVK